MLGEISYLFSNYSLEQLLIAIVVAFILTKIIIELVRYFYDRFREYFGMKNKKEVWENTTTESLNYITNKVDSLEDNSNQHTQRLDVIETKISGYEDYYHQAKEQLEELDKSMKLVQERLQENTRSFLIDNHHKFCYEIQGIDDQSLASMERRYLYYKSAGGNSFIDDLMKEVRALPRINYATVKTPNLDNMDRREING